MKNSKRKSEEQELRLIRQIASYVRRYHEGWNPRGSRLGGLCDNASKEIVGLARRAGIRGIICAESDYGHSFVLYRLWLIDVTATQFSRRHKRVEIVKLNGQRLPPWWRWNGEKHGNDT